MIPIEDRLRRRALIPPAPLKAEPRTGYEFDPSRPSPLRDLPASVKRRLLQICLAQDEAFRLRTTLAASAPAAAKQYEASKVFSVQEKKYGRSLQALSRVNHDFANLSNEFRFEEIHCIAQFADRIFSLGIAHRHARHVKAINLFRNSDGSSRRAADLVVALPFLPLFPNLRHLVLGANAVRDLASPETTRAVEKSMFRAESDPREAQRQCFSLVSPKITMLEIVSLAQSYASILDYFPNLNALTLVDPEFEKEPAHGTGSREEEDDEEEEDYSESSGTDCASDGDVGIGFEEEQSAKEVRQAETLIEKIFSKVALESLEIKWRKDIGGAGIVNDQNEIEMVTLRAIIPRSWIDPRFPRLKRLSLSLPTFGWQEIAFIGSFCDSLESLVVRRPHDREERITTTRLPALPHLRYLCLGSPFPSDLSGFLGLVPSPSARLPSPFASDDGTSTRLHFPHLSSLTLDGVPDSSNFEPFLSFILAHSSTLRSLDCFEVHDPYETSSLGHLRSQPSLSNVHLQTSKLPQNAYPESHFSSALQETSKGLWPEPERLGLVLKNASTEMLKETIDRTLTSAEGRVDKAVAEFEKDGSTEGLFEMAIAYRSIGRSVNAWSPPLPPKSTASSSPLQDLPSEVWELLVAECSRIDEEAKASTRANLTTPIGWEARMLNPEPILNSLRLTNKRISRMASKIMFKSVKASRVSEPVFRFSIACNYPTLVQEVILDDSGTAKPDSIQNVEILLSLFPFFTNLRSMVFHVGAGLVFHPTERPDGSQRLGTDENHLLRRAVLTGHLHHYTSLHLKEYYNLLSVGYYLSIFTSLRKLRIEGNKWFREVKTQAEVPERYKTVWQHGRGLEELDIDRTMGAAERKRREESEVTFPTWFFDTTFPSTLTRLTLRCLRLDSNDHKFLEIISPSLKSLVIHQSRSRSMEQSDLCVGLPHLPRLEALELHGRCDVIESVLVAASTAAKENSALPVLRYLGLYSTGTPSESAVETVCDFIERHRDTLDYFDWSRGDSGWALVDTDSFASRVPDTLVSRLASTVPTKWYKSGSLRHPYFACRNIESVRDADAVPSSVPITRGATIEDERIAIRRKFVTELRKAADAARSEWKEARSANDQGSLERLASALAEFELERSVEDV